MLIPICKGYKGVNAFLNRTVQVISRARWSLKSLQTLILRSLSFDMIAVGVQRDVVHVTLADPECNGLPVAS